MIELGVNIDHVATVRNARGGTHPDPVRAALLAQAAGANARPRATAQTELKSFSCISKYLRMQ